MHEGHRERLRKQIEIGGLDSLSDIQLLEFALFYVYSQKDTNEIAHRLLTRFGSLSGVLEAPKEELLKVDGVGIAAANYIGLFLRMERRHILNRSTKENILDTTSKCGKYLVPYFIGEQEEVVYLLCLDAKCKAIDCQIIHRGAINSAQISIRKIVKAALDRNATSVVVAHNHPSGIALASAEDYSTTKAIKAALDTVDVKLADHIIVADNDFISLSADGMV